MSKSLITLLGVVVCGVILVLGVTLGAVPLLTQTVAVAGQSAQVAKTNELYAESIVALRAEEERLDEINASIEGLRQGITADPRLDGVFELVATAAATSGVVVETITAGDAVAFTERTVAVPLADQTEPIDEAPAPTASPSPDASAGAEADPGVAATAQAPSGRMQVDFTIRVNAADVGQAVAFLDGLRAGPRLFANVETLVISTGEVINVDVTGLTFLLPEG